MMVFALPRHYLGWEDLDDEWKIVHANETCYCLDKARDDWKHQGCEVGEPCVLHCVLASDTTNLGLHDECA